VTKDGRSTMWEREELRERLDKSKKIITPDIYIYVSLMEGLIWVFGQASHIFTKWAFKGKMFKRKTSLNLL
jgi:hypothetical protein